jgi:hypothetical protein
VKSRHPLRELRPSGFLRFGGLYLSTSLTLSMSTVTMAIVTLPPSSSTRRVVKADWRAMC